MVECGVSGILTKVKTPFLGWEKLGRVRYIRGTGRPLGLA